MTYFVYIESQFASVPHMEPVDAENPSAATLQALKLLCSHNGGVVAHVYEDDAMIASVKREDAVGGLEKNL